MTLLEAFEAFEIDELLSENRSEKTIKAYRGTCRSFLRAIGSDVDVSFITYGHIIQWKKNMHDRRNTGAHMALQLRELRRVLTYLNKHGFTTLDANEIKIPHFKYKETAWLTVEEVQRFLSVIQNPRDKALFACMFSSGARISELLSLNRDSIQGNSAPIIGKGKVEGRLLFDTTALSLVDAYLAGRTDKYEPLFISRQNKRICVQQCIRLAHHYAELAGIQKNVTTHVLRHSFGTDLEMNGLDIHGISIQMRHKKLETTKIYLHGAELRKQADFNRFHTSVPLSE